MSASYPDLDGASVFITGGGSGIGAALTEGFLRQGAKVAFIGRSDYAEFVDEMEEATGNRPRYFQGDVTETAAYTAILDEAAAAQGPIDVLVNNAANDMRFDPLEITAEDWDSQLAINLSHQFHGAAHVGRAMVSRGAKGRIVNFSSIVFQMGAGGLLPYETAKAGVLGLTRGLAREFGPSGIRVNAIAPGMVLTEKQLEKWVTPEGKEEHIGKQCLKDELPPESMVGPCLFLASGASYPVTGQCLIADAGVVFGA